MTILIQPRRLAVAALCTTAVAAGPALAQDEALLVVRGPGLKQIFIAPQDEGLARAMGMLGQRLTELPTEISMLTQDDEHAQEGLALLKSVMPMIVGMIDHPCELAIIDHGGMVNMMPDLDARIIVQTGNRDTTAQMHNAVQFLARMAAQEHGLALSPGQNQLMSVALPMGQFIFGPANEAQTQFIAGFDSAGDGLAMGALTVPGPAELPSAELDGQIYFNLKAAARVAQRVMEASGEPDAMNMSQMIEGFLPEGPLDLIGASAIKDGRRWSVLRMRGGVTLMQDIAATMEGMGVPMNVQFESIPADSYRLIPRDVTMASAQVQDLSSFAEPASMAAAMAGVPELAALVDALGKTWVAYMADETGGGGLMSLVMIQPDVDGPAMADALSSLANTANLHATPLHGYVRVRQWDTTSGGKAASLFSLAFPGLPVPIEVSLGVIDERLVIGATPQGVLAAVDHWRSGRPSLTDNPRFRQASAGMLEHAIKVSFMDMPATINRGYPIAQMVGAAVANFVRSPVDPSRDPGLVTPSVAALSKNAQAWIGVTSVDGDDFVYKSSGDPSLMVNIAGGAGSMGVTPALVGIGIAAAMAEEHKQTIESREHMMHMHEMEMFEEMEDGDDADETDEDMR